MQLIPILHIIFYLTTLWLPKGVTSFTITSGYDQKLTWARQADGAWRATTENGKDAGLWSVDGLVVSVTTNGQIAKTDISQFVARVPTIYGGTTMMDTVCGKPVHITFSSETSPNKLKKTTAVQFTQDDKDAPFAKQVAVAFSYK
jgi:hypothetical protein